MSYLIKREDLAYVQVEPQEAGFIVKARCPICRGLVMARLSSTQVEMGDKVSAACASGNDNFSTFQLSVRYSPTETDFKDGVDVWGDVYSEMEG